MKEVEKLRKYLFSSCTLEYKHKSWWFLLDAQTQKNLFSEILVGCLNDCEKYVDKFHTWQPNQTIKIAHLSQCLAVDSPQETDNCNNFPTILRPLVKFVDLARGCGNDEFYSFVIETLADYLLSPFNQEYVISTPKLKYSSNNIMLEVYRIFTCLIFQKCDLYAHTLPEYSALKKMVQVMVSIVEQPQCSECMFYSFVLSSCTVLFQGVTSALGQSMHPRGFYCYWKFLPLDYRIKVRDICVQTLRTMVTNQEGTLLTNCDGLVSFISLMEHEIGRETPGHNSTVCASISEMVENLLDCIINTSLNDDNYENTMNMAEGSMYLLEEWSGMEGASDDVCIKLLAKYFEVTDMLGVFACPPRLKRFDETPRHFEGQTVEKLEIKSISVALQLLWYGCSQLERNVSIKDAAQVERLLKIFNSPTENSCFLQRTAFRCLVSHLSHQLDIAVLKEYGLFGTVFNTVAQAAKTPAFLRELCFFWALDVTFIPFISADEISLIMNNMIIGLRSAMLSGGAEITNMDFKPLFSVLVELLYNKNPTHFLETMDGFLYSFIKMLNEVNSEMIPITTTLLPLKDIAARSLLLKKQVKDVPECFPGAKELLSSWLKFEKEEKKELNDLLLGLLADVIIREMRSMPQFSSDKYTPDIIDCISKVPEEFSHHACLAVSLLLDGLSDELAVKLLTCTWRFFVQLILVQPADKQDPVGFLAARWRPCFSAFPLIPTIFSSLKRSIQGQEFLMAVLHLLASKTASEETKQYIRKGFISLLPEIANQHLGKDSYSAIECYVSFLINGGLKLFVELFQEQFPQVPKKKLQEMFNRRFDFFHSKDALKFFFRELGIQSNKKKRKRELHDDCEEPTKFPSEDL